MTKSAAVLLSLSGTCLVAGAWMLLPAVGVLVLGVLLGVAGVLSLDLGGAR